jgi:trans-aconitate 2-methyltransferase
MTALMYACAASMAEFVKDDIEHWKPQGSVDLIFANASLHFVVNHRSLLLLAVQMPRNTHELSHAAMRMVAADGPWAPRLVPVAKTRANIGPPTNITICSDRLCRELDIWGTSYAYPLNGVDEVVQWFEGSGLRPFLELLSEDEQASFSRPLSRETQRVSAPARRQVALEVSAPIFCVADAGTPSARKDLIEGMKKCP